MSAYMIYIRDEITDQKEMDIYNEESKKAPHEYEAEPLAFYGKTVTLEGAKKTLEKSHVEASKSLVDWYGYDFAKMMTKNFERITLSDIDAICHACCTYDMKTL